MTYREECTLPEDVLELLTKNGLDALPQALTLLLNTALQAERQKYIGVTPYERLPQC